MTHRTYSRRSAGIAPALLGAFALLVPASASAQSPAIQCDGTTDFPCSFQVKDVNLQKVPAIFKFQSRVSQAKLPIGQGVFDQIIVKVMRGTDTLCLEEFAAVQVRDSVLNLEIGRNMGCELDEIIAENTDLTMQVCLGGPENCLKPIDLAAAPYAVKASFASTAQRAYQANKAGTANYALRVTADRDVLTRKELGTGYFDFFSKDATTGANSWPAGYGTYATYADGGFLQWAPIRQTGAKTFTIIGKDHASDAYARLDEVVLNTNKTTSTGAMWVTTGGAHVTGDSEVEGTMRIAQTTTVQAGGIHVTGDSDVAGTMQISKATTVQAGGVHVTGDSNVTGQMLISARTEVQSGGIHVTGNSNVAGQLVIANATQVQAGGIQVTGDSQVTGALTATGNISGQGSLGVTGAASVGGGLTVSAGGGTFTGQVAFNDLVEFRGGISGVTAVPNSNFDVRYLLANTETRDWYNAGAIGGKSVAVDGLGGIIVTPGGGLVLNPGAGRSKVTAEPAFEVFAAGPSGVGLRIQSNPNDVQVMALDQAQAPRLLRISGSDVELNGNIAIQGATTFTSTVDFSGATVSGLTLSGAFTEAQADLKYLKITGETRDVRTSGIVDGSSISVGGLAAFTRNNSDLLIAGPIKMSGQVDFSGANVTGLAFTGNVDFSGANVTGLTALTTAEGDSRYIKATGENRSLDIGGSMTFSSTVTFDQIVDFNGSVDFSGATVVGLQQGATFDQATADGLYYKASAETRKVSTTGGLEAIGGGLTVTGGATLNTGLNVTGATTLNTGLTVNGTEINGSAKFKIEPVNCTLDSFFPAGAVTAQCQPGKVMFGIHASDFGQNLDNVYCCELQLSQ